jgi:hypothetical protein
MNAMAHSCLLERGSLHLHKDTQRRFAKLQVPYGLIVASVRDQKSGCNRRASQ